MRTTRPLVDVTWLFLPGRGRSFWCHVVRHREGLDREGGFEEGGGFDPAGAA